jgi:hypothetical protein
VLCAGAGVALGWMLSHSLTTEALDAEQTALACYVDGVVGPTLVHGDKVVVSPRDKGRFASSVRRSKEILSVKVWRADGALAWTNVDPERIGHTFPLEDQLGHVIRENQPIADLAGTGGDAADEDAFERNELARAPRPPAVRGVRADREQRRLARDRGLRDLRQSCDPQPPDRLPTHDAVARRRRGLLAL